MIPVSRLCLSGIMMRAFGGQFLRESQLRKDRVQCGPVRRAWQTSQCGSWSSAEAPALSVRSARKRDHDHPNRFAASRIAGTIRLSL
ncbi:hypothetical protein [Azospirillum argentinense]|uniref:Uncharacterized protein n=1 Tax=Azospirillum argentinense TaxID=2970906 RepID=A0A5B0KVB1_9PROT|nr:hypothetical protein FH063_003540 [Azospirillum argentinense]